MDKMKIVDPGVFAAASKADYIFKKIERKAVQSGGTPLEIAAAAMQLLANALSQIEPAAHKRTVFDGCEKWLREFVLGEKGLVNQAGIPLHTNPTPPAPGKPN